MREPKPTWLVIEVTPPAPLTDAARKAPAPPAYYSPLLLSPLSVWPQQKAQHTGIKKGRAGHGRPGGVPASPRIGCMGQVNGGTRCSSRSGPSSEYGGGLAGLLMGLFRRRRTSKGRKPRACCKVRDVPSDSSSTGSTRSSSRGSRAPAAAACAIDPPLPVPVPAVRRAAREDNAPSLWERRRGVGKALEGLQLT